MSEPLNIDKPRQGHPRPGITESALDATRLHRLNGCRDFAAIRSCLAMFAGVGTSP
ncbi:MAG: hypothetical protein ABIQ18_42040 [Umezawaea sp.]